MFYLRNNEYFNEITDGYTLIGYYINPFIVYKPIEKVQIEAGIFTRKEFGTSGLKELEPTLKITLKNNNWKYIFGNIDGNLKHRLIEPIMSFERFISYPLEHGVQAKYEYKEIFFDVWLDWQRSTLAGTNVQEKIWGGVSYFSKAIWLRNLQLQGIFQASIYHIGGQNLQTYLPISTSLNPTFGIRLKRDFNQNQRIIFDSYYLKYFETPLRGTGYYVNTYWQNKHFQAGFSYWKGNHFNSPLGNDIMQSSSRKQYNRSYYEQSRNLVIGRFARDWVFTKNIGISIRFEPIFDFNSRLLNHSEGLYLKCNF